MNNNTEIAEFKKLLATRTNTNTWTEGGDYPPDLRQRYPWFNGSVVAAYGKCITILFATEQNWFLSHQDYDEMSMIYLGNDARTSWNVFNSDDSYKNAPYCDIFEPQLLSASTWWTFQELQDCMEQETNQAEAERDTKRVEELACELLKKTGEEKLSSFMMYSVGQWMVKPRLRKFWTALFITHVGTVQRRWWPREFAPMPVHETVDLSHYTVTEHRVLTLLHTYSWPNLDSVDAGLVCQRQVGFEGHLTPQLLELMRECMTRHQMLAPFDLTLWRATSKFDCVNPMLAFTLSHASAQKFLENNPINARGTVQKVDIPVGTPIFPIVVYAATAGYKSEGEILVTSEVVRKHLSQQRELTAAVTKDMQEKAAIQTLSRLQNKYPMMDCRVSGDAEILHPTNLGNGGFVTLLENNRWCPIHNMEHALSENSVHFTEVKPQLMCRQDIGNALSLPVEANTNQLFANFNANLQMNILDLRDFGLYGDFPIIHQNSHLNQLCFHSLKGTTRDVAKYAVALMPGKVRYYKPTWYRFTGTSWRYTEGPDGLLTKELVTTYETLRLKFSGHQKQWIYNLIVELSNLETRKRFIEEMEHIISNSEGCCDLTSI